MIDLDEYNIVLVSSIKVDQAIPFDCYIHLKAMGKFILWVQKGESFPSAKLEKLQKGNVDKVYFKREDQEAYKKYLLDYFQTPEGRAMAKDLSEEEIGEVEGLSEALSLGALDQEDQKQNVGSVEVVDYGAGSGGTKFEHPIDQTISRLEKDLERLELSGDEAEALIRIRSVTEKINEEMIKISRYQKPYSEDDQIRIKEATEIIREELIAVGPFLEAIPDKYRKTVSTYLDKIDKLLLSEEKKEGEQGVFGEHFEEIQKTGSDLTEYLDKTQKVSDSIETKELINQLTDFKKNGGGASTSKEFGDIDIKDMGKLFEGQEISLDLISSHSPGHSSLIEKLKETIRKQAAIIKGLNSKMMESQKAHETVRSKWLVFETLVKRKMDMQDQQEARQINALLRVFSGSHTEAITAMKGVSEVSSDLLSSVGLDINAVEAEFIKEDTAGKEPGSDPDDTGEEGASAEELAENDAVMNSIDIEKLSSENEVLRVQLKNAQSLLDDTCAKLDELEKNSVDRNSYISEIESTMEDLKKQIEYQETELLDWRKKEDNFNDAMEKADTEIYKYRSDQGSFEQNNDELVQKMKQMETELEYFRSRLKEISGKAVGASQLESTLENIDPKKLIHPEELAFVLEAKEKEIKRFSSKLEGTAEQLKKMTKDVGQLNIKLERAKTDQITAEKRLSAAEVKADNEKSHNRTLSKKLETSNHLLKEAHKSISKLTTISENLKSDRQKYIVETNKALNKFRDMTSKALSLQRNSEANEQRANEISKKYEITKKKELELKKEVNKLNGTVRTLKKKIKIFLEKSGNGPGGESAA